MHWTRDQVLDQIDMPFLDALKSVWEDWPPLRKYYAAVHGHKPPAPVSRDYSELAAMFPGGVIKD